MTASFLPIFGLGFLPFSPEKVLTQSEGAFAGRRQTQPPAGTGLVSGVIADLHQGLSRGLGSIVLKWTHLGLI